MAERARHLVLFLREPVPGRVKTRLGRDIGMIEACWWYRHAVRDLIRRVGRDPRWHTWLAVTPDRAVESRFWPEDLPCLPQGGGDLGARMARIFRTLPPGPVLIMGGDIPRAGAAHIAEAFALLGRSDAVFGPTPDGGFWLAGLSRGRRKAPAGLFRNVRWSTRHALADSLQTLGDARVSFAAPLPDIDTGLDLAMHRATGGRGGD
ncbi:MAG: glycosyltransferase [Alphaproteobacteria bacterium]|nr:MAG: glycosyltransferase [Alphaproteobacteria bacterium]